MHRLRFPFFIFLLIFTNNSIAQSSNADSLRNLLKMPAADTVRLSRLDDLISLVGPSEEGQKLNEEMGQLSEKLRKSSNPAIKRSANTYYASYLGNSGFIAEEHGDISAALDAYQKALPVLDSAGQQSGVASLLNNIGYIYAGLGNIPRALEYYQRSLDIREKIGDQRGIATNINNLATMYRDQGDMDKALDYFKRFCSLCEKNKDSTGIALALTNIGNLYLTLKDTTNAARYLNNALTVALKTKSNRQIGHTLFSLGNLSFYCGNYDKATALYNESLIYDEKAKVATNIVNAKTKLAECYLKKGDTDKALLIAQEADTLAKKIGYTEAIMGAAHLLKDIYVARGDSKMALSMYEREVTLRDSLVNEKNRKLLLRNELEAEYTKKKNALAVENEKVEQKAQQETLLKNFALGVLGIVVIFLLLAIAQRNRISRERKRSDELLLNILPGEVAEELKRKGRADTQAFEEVTVIFTDFKEFTQISERLQPKELVEELDYCFREFDTITAKYGIEKIKTIGDSYMAAGGLPIPNKTHALDVVGAAMEMNSFIQNRLKSRSAEGKEAFNIRIGIHTGPVVAGIVGAKKFAYDIWGDTVNTASRMESSSDAGRINISEVTYSKVKHRYTCTSRGKISVKGKGEIEMYFVEGLVKES